MLTFQNALFVLQCNKCFQIVGDSIQWITNSGNKIILGKTVNVFKSNEKQLDEFHSVYTIFSCSGCSQPLGMNYLQNRLEHNQFADVYTFLDSKIRIYFVGGGNFDEIGKEDPMTELKKKQSQLTIEVTQMTEAVLLLHLRLKKLEGT